LLKVALDIHQILMLKNKIYKYLFNEIFKNFITILFTFTAIAWVVRAVNFLDLMVSDGYSSSIYFEYSLLNLSNIMSRFVPLAFLLSLTISIVKFERQQEFLILWSSGLSKIKIANIFLFISIFVTLFQLVLYTLVNPFLLNKSRFILSTTETPQINTVLRSNDFSDSYRGITFFVEKKNSNNELINIFIKDLDGNFSTLVDEVEEKKDTTIFAKKGFINNDKLILFEGVIQTLNRKDIIKNVKFEQTELTLGGIATRTIKLPKIQETSSVSLLKCFNFQYSSLNQELCNTEYKKEVTQALSRRFGAPLYIPLVTIIISFLLLYNKEKKYIFLKKYILFILSFLILVFGEILLKYTSISPFFANSYFILPVAMSLLFYLFLIRKMMTEKI